MQLNEIHDNHEHASTSLKVILLVFAIVLVGTLGYLVWQQNNTTETTNYSNFTNTEKKSETDEQADSVNNWRTYKNTDYGFQITLTNAWEGYRVKIENDSETPTIKYIGFHVPCAVGECRGDGMIFQGLTERFSIVVYTLADWEKQLEITEGPSKPIIENILAKTDKYVFYYGQWQDPPESLTSVNFDIEAVVKSFKLL